MPVRSIYPDEESEYAHSGLVVRNFGGISAQTCLHDCAADRRNQRTPLALACASVPPRRARPNTRHRNSGNGTLLAWMDHSTGSTGISGLHTADERKIAGTDLSWVSCLTQDCSSINGAVIRASQCAMRRSACHRRLYHRAPCRSSKRTTGGPCRPTSSCRHLV